MPSVWLSASTLSAVNSQTLRCEQRVLILAIDTIAIVAMHGNNKSSFFIKTIKQRFNYQVQNYYVCLNNPMTSPTFFVKSSFGDKNEAFSGFALILAELMCEDI